MPVGDWKIDVELVLDRLTIERIRTHRQTAVIVDESVEIAAETYVRFIESRDMDAATIECAVAYVQPIPGVGKMACVATKHHKILMPWECQFLYVIWGAPGQADPSQINGSHEPTVGQLAALAFGLEAKARFERTHDLAKALQQGQHVVGATRVPPGNGRRQ